MPDPGVSLGEGGEEVGEYTLDTRLGAGSYGAVWRARHKLMRDQEVAIKLFPPDTAGRRIVREAQALGSVQSPHVPRLLGGNAEAEPPYIAMEFIQGESLREVLTRRRRLGEAEVVDLATQVLEGLQDAHAHGVLHRDIKPENLIVQGTLGAGCRVVLVDFGLARLDGVATDGALQLSGGLRSAQGIAGTPVYMAPEVLSGKSASPASDLFSVGIVLHECLTGRTPTAVRMFTFPMQEVSEGLSDWLKKTLAEEPSWRWGNARTMRSGLAAALPSRPAPAPGPRIKEPPTASLTHLGAWAFVLLLIGLILVGATTYISIRDKASERAAFERDQRERFDRVRAEALARSQENDQARLPLVKQKQAMDCVDVNGVAEFDYVPGRKSGDAMIVKLPSENDAYSLSVFISPGTGFGDSTWDVRISPVDAGENDVIAEFQLPRDQLGTVKTRLREAAYDRSDPSRPCFLRQAFKTELTALDLGPNNTVRRLAVRVKVLTER